MNEKRKRIWIDGFQTRLYLRLLAYCLIYQVAVWILPTVWLGLSNVLLVITGQQLLWDGWVTPIIALLFLAPMITWDAIRFAHRLVGPLYRFRKTIQSLTEGEPVELVRLRHGDFLQEMKDDLNQLLLALEARGAIELKSARADAGPVVAAAQ